MDEYPEWLQGLINTGGNIASGLLNLIYDPNQGGIQYQNIVPFLSALATTRANDSSTISDFFGLTPPQPTGYTGGIPQYEYKREVLPEAFAQTYTRPATEEGGLPTVMPRRPGSGGRYYFTQGTYQPRTTTEGAAPIVQNNDGPSGTASDLPLDNQARNQAYINRVFGTLGTGVGNSPEREDYTEGFPSLAGGGLASLYSPGGSVPRPGQSISYDVPDASYPEGSALNPYTLFDEMGRIHRGGDFRRLTQSDPTGPESPASDEFLREIERLEKTRREKSTRTAGEFFKDYAKYVVGSLIDAGPMSSESMRALAMYERMLQNQIDSGKISEDEAKRLYLNLATSRREAPDSPLERRQFNKENPDFLPNLEAMKEARRRVMNARDGEGMAAGGLASLGKGYYLGGPTDGMADMVPATIDGVQPAALSDGEFVVPADVVSHLGNGNSDAGAQQLYSMMDRVRRERTGTTKQGPEINPTRMMPA